MSGSPGGRGLFPGRFSPLWIHARVVTALLTSLLAVVACAGLPPIGDGAGSTASDGAGLGARDDLTEVGSRIFTQLQIRRGAELTEYREVLVEPLEFAEDLDTGRFRYRERDFEVVRANFHQRFVRELGSRASGKGRAGPGVLRLDCVLTGLVANRPPMGVERGSRGPSQAVSSSVGVGSASIRLELRDSVSDELLLVAVDRYRGWPLGSNLHAVVTWGDANHAFSLWARALARILRESGSTPG